MLLIMWEQRQQQKQTKSETQRDRWGTMIDDDDVLGWNTELGRRLRIFFFFNFSRKKKLDWNYVHK